MEIKESNLWKEFVKEHHVLQLAVSGKLNDIDELWCCSAFYSFNEFDGKPYFIIASSVETKHIQIALSNNQPIFVAGTIALETEKVGKIQGLQFKAVLKETSNSLTNRFRLSYLKRFPYAILKGGDLWILEIKFIKYTDNRLGFGTKYLEEF